MQLIDIGLIIITNAKRFGRNIRKWHSKPAGDKSCIDPDTGILTGTVPTILHTLFESYGDITAQSLSQKKVYVKKITYARPNPIAIILHTSSTPR